METKPSQPPTRADARNNPALISAEHWHARLGAASIQGRIECEDEPVLLRFRDIDGRIDQPALRENVLALHLGGPKRVTRLRGRARDIFDVDECGLTTMPAGEAFRWCTEGPVDFAHLTLSDRLLRRIVQEEFDRDPDVIRLRAVVNADEPEIRALFRLLLADLERPMPAGLYRESLLTVLSFHLVRRFSTLPEPVGADRPPSRAAGGLAGWQLRRVTDYMRAHLAEPVRLADLVALTGLSRAQFFRAFGHSTGRSPHAFLTDLRVTQARALLRDTRLPVARVAEAVGLDIRQLSASFRKRFGAPPGSIRRQALAAPTPTEARPQ